MLYLLIMTDTELSYDDYSEDFLIGIFKTEKHAKQTAEFYLKNVKGFCDYSCNYRIIPKKIDENFISDRVWIVYGYDINENSDEVNVIESCCCTTKEKAESELEYMKNNYKREEWDISCIIIGEKSWQDGFERV